MCFKECPFNTKKISDFRGCPALDYDGEDENCDGCRYILDAVKAAMLASQPKNSADKANKGICNHLECDLKDENCEMKVCFRPYVG